MSRLPACSLLHTVWFSSRLTSSISSAIWYFQSISYSHHPRSTNQAERADVKADFNSRLGKQAFPRPTRLLKASAPPRPGSVKWRSIPLDGCHRPFGARAFFHSYALLPGALPPLGHPFFVQAMVLHKPSHQAAASWLFQDLFLFQNPE